MKRSDFLKTLGVACAAVLLAPAVNLLAEPETPCNPLAEMAKIQDQIQLLWLKYQNQITKAERDLILFGKAEINYTP